MVVVGTVVVVVVVVVGAGVVVRSVPFTIQLNKWGDWKIEYNYKLYISNFLQMA